MKGTEMRIAHRRVARTGFAILAGLWSLRGDTLGGLTGPLTFVEGQPAKSPACWFHLTIQDSVWTTPDGFQLHCL